VSAVSGKLRRGTRATVPDQLPQCERTGKVPFKSKAKARKALLHGKAPSRNEQKAVYLCPFCGHWHLTKQSQRRPR